MEYVFDTQNNDKDKRIISQIKTVMPNAFNDKVTNFFVELYKPAFLGVHKRRQKKLKMINNRR